MYVSCPSGCNALTSNLSRRKDGETTRPSPGIAGLGAGGVAVFITHVEAGPVALLAVGLIFMIVALGGRLPTRLKIGENGAEWQEAAGEVIETALDAAPPSARAELAVQLRELAEVALGPPRQRYRVSHTKTASLQSLQTRLTRFQMLYKFSLMQVRSTLLLRPLTTE
jgi:hypothetical protein